MHSAARRDDAEQMESLLAEASWDHNVCDSDGRTAVYIVCEKGHEAVMRMLFEAGADVDKATMSAELALRLGVRKASRVPDPAPLSV